MDVIYAILLFFAKIITIMGLLAILETSIVKMRFYRVHEFLTVAAVLATLGLVGALFFSVI
jgi:formate hydrogenlyase subunit 4